LLHVSAFHQEKKQEEDVEYDSGESLVTEAEEAGVRCIAGKSGFGGEGCCVVSRLECWLEDAITELIEKAASAAVVGELRVPLLLQDMT
jgi:hypothetical protein